MNKARRPSGFTDAELAAAAWRRNMQMKDTMALPSELFRGDKGHRKKKKTRDGEEGRKKKSKRKKRGREERSRSPSLGSVDSLGRERKATRSRSQGSSDSGRDRRRRSRRRKRAKDKDDNGEEFGEMEKALGWRGAMARASRSASVLPPGDGVRRKGWSSSSSAGSFSSDRGTDGESDVDPTGPEAMKAMAGREVGVGAGLLGGAADVPEDPRRPEHDDRDRRWRGGWKSGVSVGIMARGSGGLDSRSAARDASEQRGRNRYRRGVDDEEFHRERGRGRGSSRDSRRRSRSLSQGGADSARSLSRSMSRDRRSRRSSRSRSPSFRRSRSRDRAVWGLIEQFRSGDDPEGTAAGSTTINTTSGGNEKPRADAVDIWTHDLYDEVKTASPPRSSLPQGWKPEPESWVSRAGGVYLPTKPP